MVLYSEFKLCYVEDSWAWFTTQPIDKQWGDDWNDAPYEHNAGNPYPWDKCDASNGRPRWDLMRVAWYGPLETPCDGVSNSPYSVDDINAGIVPWLKTDRYTRPPIHIMAGTTLPEFIVLVRRAGGQVYMEVPSEQGTLR